MINQPFPGSSNSHTPSQQPGGGLNPAAAASLCGECRKISAQLADISLPLELKPLTTVSDIRVECLGEPQLACGTDCGGATCELLITQRVRVSIPVKFDVDISVGESSILCGSSPVRCERRTEQITEA